MTLPQPIVTIRISDHHDGALLVEIYTGATPETAGGLITLCTERLVYRDGRDTPEVFWHSIAQRMDDAHNAGEPLWSRLTDAEVCALTDDRTEIMPDSPSTLGRYGRDSTDHRVTVSETFCR